MADKSAKYRLEIQQVRSSFPTIQISRCRVDMNSYGAELCLQ